MKIKYDNQLMKLMYFFESITHSKLKDCFIDKNDVLNFIVNEDIAKAIGKNGVNAKKVEAKLKRRIKIVAFSENLEEFISNLLLPLKVKDITVDEGIVTITPEPESRGYIIGRAASNLRNYEETVKRYFEIKEIKVV
tara:strand:+ start:250 stop:660 length:411 start_codon:yes stop_codon:yes gene_type:complete